jgi:hypothetical protein
MCGRELIRSSFSGLNFQKDSKCQVLLLTKFWMIEPTTCGSLQTRSHLLNEQVHISFFCGIICEFDEFLGNVLVSNADGYKFTVALQNVHQGLLCLSEKQKFVDLSVFLVRNWWDFEVVKSLEGVYLANVLENAHSSSFFVKTLITFDNGNEWKTIPAPGNPQ